VKVAVWLRVGYEASWYQYPITFPLLFVPGEGTSQLDGLLP
jgi:hypothetical protein